MAHILLDHRRGEGRPCGLADRKGGSGGSGGSGAFDEADTGDPLVAPFYRGVIDGGPASLRAAPRGPCPGHVVEPALPPELAGELGVEWGSGAGPCMST
jgi:hypothetical protein